MQGHKIQNRRARGLPFQQTWWKVRDHVIVVIVIIAGVADVTVVINFTCNVKLWEIAITLYDAATFLRILMAL